MKNEIEKELYLLEKEKIKNLKEIEINKNKIINELKKIDKNTIFNENNKTIKKKSFFYKLIETIYGKKR